MGGFHVKPLFAAALVATTALAAGDDEPEFGSTGASIPAPPPRAAIAAQPALSAGQCPPATKNEVCRCVVYDKVMDWNAEHYVAAKNAPKYCKDPRLISAFHKPESEYLTVLFQVQKESGEPGHDG